MDKFNRIVKFLVVTACGSLATMASAGVNDMSPSLQTPVMLELSQWKFGDSFSKIQSHLSDERFNPFVKDSLGKDAYDYSVKYKVKPIQYVLAKQRFKNMYLKYQAEDMEVGRTPEAKQKSIVSMVIKGKLVQLKQFLSENPSFELNYQIGKGITPLAATALVKDVDLAASLFNALVDNGADVNFQVKEMSGDSIGHVFCSSDNFLMLLLGISRGYDINLLNDEGKDVFNYSQSVGAKYCEAHLLKMIIDNK